MYIISTYSRKLYLVLHSQESFVIGFGKHEHTQTHDINAQTVHCQPVKMGLTTEVKGCVFNG